jgi:hypothetical protein
MKTWEVESLTDTGEHRPLFTVETEDEETPMDVCINQEYITGFRLLEHNPTRSE